MKQGLRVAVEGNIGVGKSTLLPRLQEALAGHGHWEVLSERVDEDPEFKKLLQDFYQNSNKQVQLQSWLTHRRLFEYKALANNPANFLLERSFLGELVFCHANLVRHERPEASYLRFFYDVVDALKQCHYDALIYLKASPEACFERIRYRSREAESSIPFDYVQYLHGCYEVHLTEAARVHRIPLITVDWNQFGAPEDISSQLLSALEFYGRERLQAI